MKKLRTSILALLCLSLFDPAEIHADLSDFKDDVEDTKEQSEERRRDEKDDEIQNSGSYEDGEDGEGSIVARIVLEILQFIWVVNNTTTTYGAYPYSPSGYIKWAEPVPGWEEHYRTNGYRDQWFALDAQGVYLENLGFGSWLTFRGHLYRFFGPYFDTWTITDGSDVFYGYRLGGSFSLFQSDPFSLSVFLQYDAWRGILNEDGLHFGGEIRSFPARPIGLQYRAGIQIFDGFNVIESDAQLGLIFERIEVFGGYRWWGITNSAGELTVSYAGPMAGIRLHF
jgi:hypothetical protein